MGRPDNKWEDLTTNGKTRQQMGRPDKKIGRPDNKREDLTTNGKT
jgi:hypothetical protein